MTRPICCNRNSWPPRPELRGKLWAKQAELEILLASKPDDAAAIKTLAGEILNLRGTLFERTIEFRLRLAKEAGLPIRASRNLLAPPARRRPAHDAPQGATARRPRPTRT